MRRPRRRDRGGEDPPYEDRGRDHRAGGEAQKNKGGVPNPHPNPTPVRFRFKTKQNEEHWKDTVIFTPGALSSFGGPVGPSALAAKSERRKGTREKKIIKM